MSSIQSNPGTKSNLVPILTAFGACMGVVLGMLINSKLQSKEKQIRDKKEAINIRVSKFNNTTNMYRLSLISFNTWYPYEDSENQINQAWGQQPDRKTGYNRRPAILAFFRHYLKTTDIFALQEVTLPLLNLLNEIDDFRNNFEIIKCDVIHKPKHKDAAKKIFDSIETVNLVADMHEDSDTAVPLAAKIPRSQIKNYTCVIYNKHLYHCESFESNAFSNPEFTLVKLRPKWTNNYTIIIVSLQLIWEGNELELKSHKSLRINQMNAMCEYIDTQIRSKTENELIYICGDLNASYHPIRVGIEYGYTHCFSDCCNSVARRTYPTPAVHLQEDVPDLVQSESVYDWIMCHKGDQKNVKVKGVTANIVDFHHCGVYPSDHYPIQAIYQIVDTNTTTNKYTRISKEDVISTTGLVDSPLQTQAQTQSQSDAA